MENSKVLKNIVKTVGIIGGLGPQTTSEFYLDIIFSCQKFSGAVRPGILISSVPLPLEIEEDFIMLNKGADRYVPFLLAEAKRLESAGADFLVMPCNSLHIFINEIRNEVGIPVLSIIEETVSFLKKNNFKKVAIISTSATVENRLYETAFEENKIDCAVPDGLEQVKMGKIIMNLVNGQQNNRDREEIIKIIDNFEIKKVDCVALACTDLQLLMPQHRNLKIFDTMKILSDSTVRELLK